MNKLFLFLSITLSTFYSFTALAGFNLDSTTDGGSSGSFFVEMLDGNTNATTAVVVLHGRCGSPTSAVAQELRVSLNNSGYTTLSISNPLTQNGGCNFSDYANEVATIMPEVYARVRTAINHLQTTKSNLQNVALVGFSLGSRFASAHIARGQLNELPIIAYAGIGMNANSIDPLNLTTTLDEISIPVLDLYGDADTYAVNTAAARLSSYAGTSTSYQQTVLDCDLSLTPNECHKLTGLKGSNTSELEISVLNWMNCYAPLGTADCTFSLTSSVTSNTAEDDTGSLNPIFFLVLLSLLLNLRRLHLIKT